MVLSFSLLNGTVFAVFELFALFLIFNFFCLSVLSCPVKSCLLFVRMTLSHACLFRSGQTKMDIISGQLVGSIASTRARGTTTTKSQIPQGR